MLLMRWGCLRGRGEEGVGQMRFEVGDSCVCCDGQVGFEGYMPTPMHLLLGASDGAV